MNPFISKAMRAAISATNSVGRDNELIHQAYRDLKRHLQQELGEQSEVFQAITAVERDLDYLPVLEYKISKLASSRDDKNGKTLSAIEHFCRQVPEFLPLHMTGQTSIGERNVSVSGYLNQVTVFSSSRLQGEQVPTSSSTKPKNILPRPQYDKLIGRDDVVGQLLQDLAGEALPSKGLVVLYGPQGVGKTAIAREVARFVSEKGGLVIWHSVDPSVDNAKKACDDLEYNVANALGLTSNNANAQLTILREHETLLIIDGLREHVADRITNRYITLLPSRVSVLITCSQRIALSHLHCQSIEVGGISPDYIPEILRLLGVIENFTEEQVREIYSTTLGSFTALRHFACFLRDQDLIDSLRLIRQNGNGVRAAVQQLRSELSRKLLQINALFDTPVHRDVLAIIAGHKPTDPHINDSLLELTNNYLLFKNKSESRYRIEDTHRQYMINQLKEDGSYAELRDRWVDFYCGLRPRRDDRNDEAGWTIFTDYQPEARSSLSYAEEAHGILTAIKYCLSGHRANNYWNRAAKLLDDFRATIFASGRWDDRVDYCRDVAEHAERAGKESIVGQFKRLLAWIYCFRDEYDLGRRYAQEALDVARSALHNGGLCQRDINIHLQTRYKAHNTLGQIALRAARNRARLGHIAKVQADQNSALAATLREQAYSHLKEAAAGFQVARENFLVAKHIVEEFFEPEVLIMQFYATEVSFYDRYPVSTTDINDERVYTRESLVRAQMGFEEILHKAAIRTAGFISTRPHYRLTANTHYYLGKTLRRLAALVPEGEANIAGRYFDDADKHLDGALQIADRFGDRVLSARVKYARCQWFASQASRMPKRDSADAFNAQAKGLASSAIDAFKTTRMRLELEDAQAFVHNRLSVLPP